ncbi:MAG: carboxypeptidase-like regulatory domain-containing protein [Myxococcota bacterium]
MLLSLSGCSVAALSERDSSIAVNECTDDRCPEGMQCSSMGCIAQTGTLSNLLFEVAPGLSAQSYSGLQFFQVGNGVPLVSDDYSLALNDVINVSGSLSATGCELNFRTADGASTLTPSTDGSIPAKVSFLPSERLWGLATSTISVTTELRRKDDSTSYVFEASLPGGSYDIYVEPFAPSEPATGSCAVLPQLFRAQDLQRSTNLKLGLANPKHLDLKLFFPEGEQSLDGWRVDMLEPVTGRVVSNAIELELPTRLDGSLLYSLGIDYVPVWGDDPKITHGELVRLTPPQHSDAPSLFFWREGLEWASAGSGVIDQLGIFPNAVSYAGRVTDTTSDARPGVPASVTFTATEVTGVSSGLFPSFIRSTKTDERGRFKLDLLPGTYRAIASPILPTNASQRPFAISTTELTVLPDRDEQDGATLSVQPMFEVQGNVLTPTGIGARGASVSAEVSPARLTTSIFELSTGDLPAVPRSSNSVIGDSSGTFSLFTAPGVYDLSVRPPASAGFAWLVIPGFEPPAPSNGLDLVLPEPLRMPAPLPIKLSVAFQGRNDSNVLLNGAAVRAYALIDATGAATTDSKAAVSAVRVAEARLDATGAATLLLPAKLDRPPEGFSGATSSQP